MNNKIFSQINIIYKHTSALRRKIISNDNASFGRLRNTRTDNEKYKENGVSH